MFRFTSRNLSNYTTRNFWFLSWTDFVSINFYCSSRLIDRLKDCSFFFCLLWLGRRSWLFHLAVFASASACYPEKPDARIFCFDRQADFKSINLYKNTLIYLWNNQHYTGHQNKLPHACYQMYHEFMTILLKVSSWPFYYSNKQK